MDTPSVARSSRPALALVVLALLQGLPGVACADLLYSASLRNGDYGGGFVLDTFDFYTCPDPDGSSCGDGNLSNIGITNTPDGVAYTNQHAVINFSVGRDFPSKQSGLPRPRHGFVLVPRQPAAHTNSQTIVDNYGFNQFNSGQGCFGAGLARHAMGTPADTSDDMVSVTWGTWHDNVWYYHTTAQAPVLTTYDEWHHVGYVWGGTTHDFEIWVDGALRAWRDLPTGVTKSWGSVFNAHGSGYNFALGEIHERIVGNSTVYGVTFRDLAIWDEVRPNGDYPMVPMPTITSIVPSSGPTTGGTTVRITGTEFFDNPTVTIGGANATVVSSQPNELVVTTPPGVAGARDVVVTTFEGSVTRTGGFTYDPAAKIAGLGTSGAARPPALARHARAATSRSCRPMAHLSRRHQRRGRRVRARPRHRDDDAPERGPARGPGRWRQRAPAHQRRRAVVAFVPRRATSS